jgi:hypothetical protein
MNGLFDYVHKVQKLGYEDCESFEIVGYYMGLSVKLGETESYGLADRLCRFWNKQQIE